MTRRDGASEMLKHGMDGSKTSGRYMVVGRDVPETLLVGSRGACTENFLTNRPTA